MLQSRDYNTFWTKQAVRNNKECTVHVLGRTFPKSTTFRSVDNMIMS